MDTSKIYPGDKITALGLTFTVRSILYQDCLAGFYDVEFIDDQDQYHHWKQAEDGGSVIRSGEPGRYFVNVFDRSVLAFIRPRRRGNGYTLKIAHRNGLEIFLGSHSTMDSALAAMKRYSTGRGYTWKET